jgi:hypothetical protein
MISLEMPDSENRDNTVYEIDTLDNVITTLCVVPSNDVTVRPMADRAIRDTHFVIDIRRPHNVRFSDLR